MLVSVSAVGTTSEEPIVVPIEIKKSHNPEAKTGLRGQLVDRYMSELGTSYGVFVVVWMDAPGIADKHKPIWSSIEKARAELLAQASSVESERVKVRVVIIDATLREPAQPS